MMVSLFPTITATTGGADVELAAVLDGIKSGRWAELVQAVRSADTKTERRLLKNKLPYFTVSGTFAKRNDAGLLQHSGAIALDIDAELNPGVSLADIRAKLEADPYTLAGFVSAGGEGYCAIVRIPTDDHLGSFRSLEAYYKEHHGLVIDSACKDVSRPRYVSYDAALYFNAAGEEWQDVLDAPQRPAPGPMPRSEWRASANGEGYGQDALARACNKIRFAPDGQKHATLNKMAFLCGGYVASGFLSEDEARQALRSAITARAIEDEKGAFKTIEDGLTAGQKKPILPDALRYQASTRLHNDSSPAGAYRVANDIAAAQGVPFENVKAAVDAIAEEVDTELLTFWNLEDPGNDKPLKLSLSVAKFRTFLGAAGFRKILSGTKYQLVQVAGQVVRPVVRGEIKDYVREYVEELPFAFDGIFRSQLEEMILRQNRLLFEEGLTEFLDPLTGEFLRDTRTKARFYFRNGWVAVTADSITEPQPYDTLPGLVWEQQLIQRDFTLLPAEEAETADFFAFLWNLSGQNEKRQLALYTLIGYYLHGYKDPSNPRIGILMDEALGMDGEANGGTGKSLIFKALNQLVPVTVIDGRAYDPKDKHGLQEVTDATRIILFDDYDARRIPFERLYNMATGTLTINRLYLGQKSYEYAVSPKVGITTNAAVLGEGGSHQRRKFEWEAAPHYGAQHQPKDEFGRSFFDEWDAHEWAKFDTLMLTACQLFLLDGLQVSEPVNLERRKLLQATSVAFVDFMDCQERGVHLYRSELLQAFRAQEGYDEKAFTPERFGKWLNAYKLYAVDFEQGQEWGDSERRGQRWIELPYKVVGGLTV